MRELSRRYAQALYENFPREDLLRAAADRIERNPELWEAMISSAVLPEEKAAVFSRLSFLKETPELLRFFQVLARNGRIGFLPEIVEEFHVLDLIRRNAAECIMTCVHEPSKDQQEKIQKLLCKLHHKTEVHLILRTDPALLGGFILNIEGVTYDQSVRGKLKRLTRYLMSAQ